MVKINNTEHSEHVSTNYWGHSCGCL